MANLHRIVVGEALDLSRVLQQSKTWWIRLFLLTVLKTGPVGVNFADMIKTEKIATKLLKRYHILSVSYILRLWIQD